MKRINGIEITATEFFFDGCHKFYLVNDAKADREKMFGYGWEESDLYPIEELPVIWTCSCGLRFIYSADLSTAYVQQGEPADFEGFDIDPRMQAVIDAMYPLEEDDEEW